MFPRIITRYNNTLCITVKTSIPQLGPFENDYHSLAKSFTMLPPTFVRGTFVRNKREVPKGLMLPRRGLHFRQGDKTMPRKERAERARSASHVSNSNRDGNITGESTRAGGGWAPATPHKKVLTGAVGFLEELLQRDDGWLRLIPSRDGSPVYAKWKFTAGKHANHYVMSVGQYWQLDYLLQLLLLKLDKVDTGDLGDLAKDTLYNHAADERRHD
jgi:hypothetical protein